MAFVWQKIKSSTRWVYDWITVIVASLVGVPEIVLQLLSYFDGIDVSAFLGPQRALQITTGVALVKAVASILENILTKEQE